MTTQSTISAILCAVLLVLSSLIGAAIEFAKRCFRSKGFPEGVHLMEACLKELATLGFINVALLLCVEVGAMRAANDRWLQISETERRAIAEKEAGRWPYSIPTDLKENLEFVHIFVFMVMVAYLLELAILTSVILQKLRFLKRMDLESRVSSLSRIVGDGYHHVAHVSEVVRFFGMKQRWRGRGGDISSLLTRGDSNLPQVRYHQYIGGKITDSMIECIELKPASIFALVLTALLIRPLLEWVQRPFVVAMTLVGVYIFIGAGVAFGTITKGLEMLSPQVDKLVMFVSKGRRDILPRLRTQMLPGNSVAVDPAFEMVMDECINALEAPIDLTPVLVKDKLFRISNRIEVLSPANNPMFFFRIMQFWLALQGAYLASLFVSTTTNTRAANEAWGVSGWWSLPVITILLIASLYIWSRTISDFAIMNSSDLQTDRSLLKALAENQEHETLSISAQAWTSLLNAVQLSKAFHNEVSNELLLLDAETNHILSELFSLMADPMTETLNLKSFHEILDTLNLDLNLDLNHTNFSFQNNITKTIFESLILHCTDFKRKPLMKQWEDLFDELDRNKDGEIWRDDLTSALKRLPNLRKKIDVTELLASSSLKKHDFLCLISNLLNTS